MEVAAAAAAAVPCRSVVGGSAVDQRASGPTAYCVDQDDSSPC